MANEAVPLAERMRPRRLDDFAGQAHLLAPGRPLAAAIAARRPHSMILWGPPGAGKTSLARLLAASFETEFVAISAVLAGVKDIRAAIERAEAAARPTLVFVDEVHRFNKAQQDAFLPHVESGLFVLIGATTENPSFEVNAALLSRCTVYQLHALAPGDLEQLLQRALDGPLAGLHLESEPRARLLQLADGDARRLYNLLEQLALLAAGEAIDTSKFEAVAAQMLRRFDKGGDVFYDQISALHKSVRGSDPDASLYWLCRMLDGGADPLYLARRIIRMASEDIGLADPRALRLALDAVETYERLGSPEGELALAQAVLYLACAPKSNAAYAAYNAARAAVAADGSRSVPPHLRNAPTRLLKQLGYGRAYRYPHDETEAYAAGENYWPDGLAPQRWYVPTERGLEAKIRAKLAHLRELDRQAGAADASARRGRDDR